MQERKDSLSIDQKTSPQSEEDFFTPHQTAHQGTSPQSEEDFFTPHQAAPQPTRSSQWSYDNEPLRFDEASISAAFHSIVNPVPPSLAHLPTTFWVGESTLEPAHSSKTTEPSVKAISDPSVPQGFLFDDPLALPPLLGYDLTDHPSPHHATSSWKPQERNPVEPTLYDHTQEPERSDDLDALVSRSSLFWEGDATPKAPPPHRETTRPRRRMEERFPTQPSPFSHAAKAADPASVALHSSSALHPTEDPAHEIPRRPASLSSASLSSVNNETVARRPISPSFADLEVVRKLQSRWMLPPDQDDPNKTDPSRASRASLAQIDTLRASRASLAQIDPLPPHPVSPSAEILTSHALEVLLSEQKLPAMPPAQHRQTVLPFWLKGKENDYIARRPRNRYETHKSLGEHPLWHVEMARDHDLRRNVVIKRIKPEMHQPHAVLRMAEEIQILAGLEHPNIPTIHDVGVDERGLYYFVTSYIEGETLRSIIKKLAAGDVRYQRRFPLQTRLQIFREILRTLRVAHKRGILHRNLTPSNIIIGESDEVRVMGWEYAKKLHTWGQDPEPLGAEAIDQLFAALAPIPGLPPSPIFRSRDGVILGSPAYMAPEQIQGLAPIIDERSDLYSLAAIFYEWLGLRYYLRPKKTFDELREGILEETPTPLHRISHQLPEKLSPRLSRFAEQGLHKEPSRRFTSIDEMTHALDQLLQEGVATQGTPQRITGGLRFLSERPALSVAFFLLFLLALAISGIKMSEWLWFLLQP
jgi:serine/threonine protein kinase